MSKDKADVSARRQYSTKIKEDFPELLDFGTQKFLKRLPMRYGENPGLPAAFYIEEKAVGPQHGHSGSPPGRQQGPELHQHRRHGPRPEAGREADRPRLPGQGGGPGQARDAERRRPRRHAGRDVRQGLERRCSVQFRERRRFQLLGRRPAGPPSRRKPAQHRGRLCARFRGGRASGARRPQAASSGQDGRAAHRAGRGQRARVQTGGRRPPRPEAVRFEDHRTGRGRRRFEEAGRHLPKSGPRSSPGRSRPSPGRTRW